MGLIIAGKHAINIGERLMKCDKGFTKMVSFISNQVSISLYPRNRVEKLQCKHLLVESSVRHPLSNKFIYLNVMR